MLKKNSNIINIGSTTGSFVISFAHLFPDCHIYSFESDLEYNSLESNVIEDNLDNVTIYNTVFAYNVLDSFKLTNVSFIRLAMESNNISVLEGAVETLTNNNCIIVVELSIKNDESIQECNVVRKFLASLGYYKMDRDGNNIIFGKKK